MARPGTATCVPNGANCCWEVEGKLPGSKGGVASITQAHFRLKTRSPVIRHPKLHLHIADLYGGIWASWCWCWCWCLAEDDICWGGSISGAGIESDGGGSSWWERAIPAQRLQHDALSLLRENTCPPNRSNLMRQIKLQPPVCQGRRALVLDYKLTGKSGAPIAGFLKNYRCRSLAPGKGDSQEQAAKEGKEMEW